MAPQKLRPLLPAQPSPLSTPSSSSPGSQPLPIRVRTVVYVPACEPCRKRKKKVRDTNLLPLLPRLCYVAKGATEVGQSVQHVPDELDKVVYLDSDASAIVDLLTTLPYPDALEIFHKLRETPKDSGTSTTTETHLRSTTWPSAQTQSLTRSLLPSNLAEQELMVRHPIAYPVMLPMSISDLPLEELTSRRPGMTATQVLRDITTPTSPDMMATDDDEESGDDALLEFCKGLPHLTNLHVEYLQKVDLTLWMDLPIPNETAVRVIALYLNNDYPVLPLFHADLFLRDLHLNQPYFCSALLISALLGWACDELGLDYLRRGLELGQKMGILNVEPGTQADWLAGYPDWTRAASYAAWGAYNLASMVSLHFRMVTVETAPSIPMPGDVDDYSAIQDDRLHISHVNGEIFKASCKLWMVFGIIVRSYNREMNMPDQTATVEFAEEIYRQLLVWADELPLELVRRPGSCHGVHMLHIYLHAITTDLFRPLLQSDLSSAPLRTFKANNATPQTVYHASIRQMKRLLLSHRSDMGPEVLSIFWQSCVIYVANAVIHSGDDQEERQFYVNLCLTGLQELFLSYRVSGEIVKAIAGMAIKNGVMDKDQVFNIRRQLEETAGRYEMDTLAVGNWVIDLDLAVTDSTGARGGKLAGDFDQMGGTQGDN
ncbi:nitrate assimilation regulatory nira [Fusarium longipes]|uniref:Nitrate assimilation regulatory nira n=1 Tax=Fusarium longipes TaxID=694270 RepID=A0A395SZU9_9HYPO|nr:nitrate assimilation regulatory nira [Fusarium longipes]